MRNIVAVDRITGIRVVEITDNLGKVIRYQAENPKLARPAFAECASVEDACNLVGIDLYIRRQVDADKDSGTAVVKVSSKKNRFDFHYEARKNGKFLGRFVTLSDARAAGKIEYNPPVVETLRADSYPEQQRGFISKRR